MSLQVGRAIRATARKTKLTFQCDTMGMLQSTWSRKERDTCKDNYDENFQEQCSRNIFLDGGKALWNCLFYTLRSDFHFSTKSLTFISCSNRQICLPLGQKGTSKTSNLFSEDMACAREHMGYVHAEHRTTQHRIAYWEHEFSLWLLVESTLSATGRDNQRPLKTSVLEAECYLHVSMPWPYSPENPEPISQRFSQQRDWSLWPNLQEKSRKSFLNLLVPLHVPYQCLYLKGILSSEHDASQTGDGMRWEHGALGLLDKMSKKMQSFLSEPPSRSWPMWGRRRLLPKESHQRD